jgi:biopolymer transport protein ExbB
MEAFDMDEILKVWESGGWVMVALFALAIGLYAQAFQLLLYVRRTHLPVETESNWFNWVRNPQNAESRIRHIIEYAQAGVTSADQIRDRFDDIRLSIVSLIDRRTVFVGTLVAAAPLMGLLGTVLGMLQTFFGISTSAGAETAGVVAAGISEALVTTQAGLTIALPGLFIVMLIQRQRKQLEASIMKLETLTLNHLKFE